MKNFFAFLAIVLCFLILIFSVNFAGRAMGLWDIKFWGVKYEDARRTKFENTKSFRDGANRDLYDLCLQYITSVEDEDVRGLLASTINQRRLSIPDSALTANTLQCLSKVY